MKTYGGVDVYLHPFLTLALGGSEWSVSCPVTLILGRAPRTHWTGGCVGPRANSDVVANRKIPLSLLGTQLKSYSP